MLNNRIFVEKYLFKLRNFNFPDDNTEGRTYYVTIYPSFFSRVMIYPCNAEIYLDHRTFCTSPLCKNFISLLDKFRFIHITFLVHEMWVEVCVLSELKL